MKFIISHDVDHLFGHEHWLRDLIYPKLWVRTGIQMISRKITVKEAFLRIKSCFQKERNCLDALMKFDKKYGVPSVFFFGMNQGLGMSYFPDEARPIIEIVHNNGFDVGVHGIAFDNFDGIKTEYDAFKNLLGFEPCGIRMHYVRYNESTFLTEASVGYIFDSTEFNKEKCGTIKAPYKVNGMWEFPLSIMDGYLTQNFTKAKEETIARIEKCRDCGIDYVTVLFHDYQFNSGYLDMRDWYIWLIEKISLSEEDSFISYKDAIKELEVQDG